MTTGKIDTTIVTVSSQEIMKRKTKETKTKMTARINIATLVDKPFYITPVSEESRLTINIVRVDFYLQRSPVLRESKNSTSLFIKE